MQTILPIYKMVHKIEQVVTINGILVLFFLLALLFLFLLLLLSFQATQHCGYG